MNNDVLIRVSGLQKWFDGGEVRALEDINADIRKGEVVVVIGPSGSGKSTFLRCLNLLERPTGGSVEFKGVDITDPKVFDLLGIGNMDVVIIAMGGHLEASVMAVMLCKEAGVPTVIVKCATEMHRKILLKVGADQAIIPESESGVRLAKNLLSSGFVDMVELTDSVSLVELDIRPEWVGKSLMELNLRKKYGINAVALRQGEAIQVAIDPTAPLTADQKLVVIADTDKLHKLH